MRSLKDISWDSTKLLFISILVLLFTPFAFIIGLISSEFAFNWKWYIESIMFKVDQLKEELDQLIKYTENEINKEDN